MTAVPLSSRYSVSHDPYAPTCSPSALLLSHYSGVTHTLQFPRQCSDSLQHPSHADTMTWYGRVGGQTPYYRPICNMRNVNTIYSVYRQWQVWRICQWTEKRLLNMPLGVNFRGVRWITAITLTQVRSMKKTQPNFYSKPTFLWRIYLCS